MNSYFLSECDFISPACLKAPCVNLQKETKDTILLLEKV